ncbi:Panacea domain-containing protein [Kallipyga gabonensis]|uniref:Panacea domain-containing protein n=1 Tax=Kallipyga gabonensis TaxID=1686287 RepID=UPI0006B6530D|nr:type II toxin-antitoxin system antitoxin SocA domain-containing protein [Kallipyga gabonensis]
MASIFDVADWFLSKESMSPKKLQKLVYYAYAWSLTLLNDSINSLEYRLFEDAHPEAWVHGPVFPELYRQYKRYGASDIPKRTGESNSTFSSDELDVLEQVWDVYGRYSANQLEHFTHQEDPWKNARVDCASYEVCTNVIKDRDIFECYADRLSVD